MSIFLITRVLTYIAFAVWILHQRRQIKRGDRAIDGLIKVWQEAESHNQRFAAQIVRLKGMKSVGAYLELEELYKRDMEQAQASYDALDVGMAEQAEAYEMDLLSANENIERLLKQRDGLIEEVQNQADAIAVHDSLVSSLNETVQDLDHRMEVQAGIIDHQRERIAEMKGDEE